VHFKIISAVEAILYVGASVNFCSCFPHLLTNLGEIWYMKVAHNVDHL